MNKRRFLLTLIAILATVVPIVAQDMMDYPSDLSECQVDLTGETLTIFHFGDLSGPYAFITQPIVSAVTDAVNYWNSHGGVCGAQLQQIYEDTGGNLEAAQSAYDRFTSEYAEELDLLLLYSSSDGELLREQLAADEITVMISAGSIESLYGEDGMTPGWLFASNPLYINQFGSFCEFVAANPETFPDPVIGFVTWPGAFGLAGTEPAADDYCGGLGVEVLDEPQIFLPTDTDILTQVQNATDAGATILYTNSLATGPALIAGTLVDLGMEDDIALAGVNWVMDTSVGVLGQRVRKANGLPSVGRHVRLHALPLVDRKQQCGCSVRLSTVRRKQSLTCRAEYRLSAFLGFGGFDYRDLHPHRQQSRQPGCGHRSGYARYGGEHGLRDTWWTGTP